MYIADETTYAMADFPIEGNVEDHTWPFIVTKENGKPDRNAIALLAHIVFWYRPTYDHQPEGSVKLGRKYKSDLLQRSYIEIENTLGLTKREAQEAFQRLEVLDFVHRELRTIEAQGQKVSNVLFIRLNHKNLKEKRSEYLKKCISSYAKKDEGIRQKGQGHTPNVMTYTENTTENSHREQQQQRVAEAPKSYDCQSTAAVSSEKFHLDQVKDYQAQSKPAASAPQPKIYQCLASVDIPEADKIEVTSRFNEDAVKNAIAWAVHPQTKITKGLPQAIKWACANKPETPKNATDEIGDNKAYAMKHDNIKNEYAIIYAFDDHVEIIRLSSSKEPFCLKYDAKGFMDQFRGALRKINMTPLP